MMKSKGDQDPAVTLTHSPTPFPRMTPKVTLPEHRYFLIGKRDVGEWVIGQIRSPSCDSHMSSFADQVVVLGDQSFGFGLWEQIRFAVLKTDIYQEISG